MTRTVVGDGTGGGATLPVRIVMRLLPEMALATVVSVVSVVSVVTVVTLVSVVATCERDIHGSEIEVKEGRFLHFDPSMSYLLASFLT
ncbi:hypothetical protein DFLDMN_005980 [Cupriavidus sp. H19C3]|uniref:hypothetical protein n=1 Tax=Cupriavidus sp. H19C3 TaxID=3241603 RepID=UPI003BF9111C